MPILECKNIALKYDGNTVCEKINFSVSEGDYICVVGENGSGKTTLLKAVLGLKAPSSGEVSLCGIARSDIGYMPQQSDIKTDFPASVFEIVLSGFIGEIKGSLRYKKEHRKRAEEL